MFHVFIFATNVTKTWCKLQTGIKFLHHTPFLFQHCTVSQKSEGGQTSVLCQHKGHAVACTPSRDKFIFLWGGWGPMVGVGAPVRMGIVESQDRGGGVPGSGCGGPGVEGSGPGSGGSGRGPSATKWQPVQWQRKTLTTYMTTSGRSKRTAHRLIGGTFGQRSTAGPVPNQIVSSTEPNHFSTKVKVMFSSFLNLRQVLSDGGRQLTKNLCGKNNCFTIFFLFLYFHPLGPQHQRIFVNLHISWCHTFSANDKFSSFCHTSFSTLFLTLPHFPFFPQQMLFSPQSSSVFGQFTQHAEPCKVTYKSFDIACTAVCTLWQQRGRVFVCFVCEHFHFLCKWGPRIEGGVCLRQQQQWPRRRHGDSHRPLHLQPRGRKMCPFDPKAPEKFLSVLFNFAMRTKPNSIQRTISLRVKCVNEIWSRPVTTAQNTDPRREIHPTLLNNDLRKHCHLCWNFAQSAISQRAFLLDCGMPKPTFAMRHQTRHNTMSPPWYF